MAIVKFKPESRDPRIETTRPEELKEPSSSTFTALVPESRINGLLKYIEGHPWTVDYYGQILNEGNLVESFDPLSSNLSQSYYLVNKCILRVSSPISSNYDANTGITTISGTSIVPAGLIPNVGDVFLANIDTGEDALFSVNSVSRLTHRKDTLYEVEYVLFEYITNRPELMTTLKKRINEEYFYNPDTNFFNRDLLISPKEHQATVDLKSFMKSSIRSYFNTFTQKGINTIAVPGMTQYYYDPLLVSFIMKTVSHDDIYPNDLHPYTVFAEELHQDSILNRMLDRQLPFETTTEQQAGFVSSRQLASKVRLGTLQYSSIEYVLVPLNASLDRLSKDKPLSLTAKKTILNEKNYSELDYQIDLTTNNNEVVQVNLLPSLFETDYYILSKGFYDYVENRELTNSLSYLEVLVFRYLNQEAITREDLYKLVEDYPNWSLLHRFYLTPLIWIMINSLIGR